MPYDSSEAIGPDGVKSAFKLALKYHSGLAASSAVS